MLGSNRLLEGTEEGQGFVEETGLELMLLAQWDWRLVCM